MRQIEYSLEAADYQEFYVLRCLRSIWRFTLIVALLASAAFAAERYCLCGTLTTRDIVDAALSGLALACLVSLAVLGLNALGGRQMHAHLSKLSIENRVEWNDEALTTHSKYVGGVFPWTLFSKWTETASLVGIYLNDMQPLIFPKRAFNAEEIDDLTNRLKGLALKKV